MSAVLHRFIGRSRRNHPNIVGFNPEQFAGLLLNLHNIALPSAHLPQHQLSISTVASIGIVIDLMNFDSASLSSMLAPIDHLHCLPHTGKLLLTLNG